eukprot:967806-Rhodomonas_salina.1
MWFAPTLSAVRLLTRALNAWIGSPETEREWNAVAELPASVLSELEHWATTLPTAAAHERPFWRLSNTQLFKGYRQNNPLIQAYLETDASIHGWGCILRVRVGDAWEEHSTSVIWDGAGQTLQVCCEAEALHQAILTFAPLLANHSLLHVTDCLPTIELPKSGTAASLELQRIALSTDVIIRSGCDAFSREELLDAHAVRLLPTSWQRVLDCAAAAHFRPDIDWLADAVNAQLPRFWSLYPHPAAACVDALLAQSWRYHSCPTCELCTPLTSFLFQQIPLTDSAVAKAQQDGARSVFVVPRLVSATWWPGCGKCAQRASPELSAAGGNTLPPNQLLLCDENCVS